MKSVKRQWEPPDEKLSKKLKKGVDKRDIRCYSIEAVARDKLSGGKSRKKIKSFS